jgi:hypothetical protein
MSTTVINQSIPAGGSASEIFAASQPYRGIEILMSQTMSKVCPIGCKASYQVSIDNGVSFSDPQAVQHEPNPSAPGTSVSHCSILINETADHVKFLVVNSDSTLCSNFTLTASTFA